MYRNDFLRHNYVQGRKIQQRVISRHENPLQTYGDIPVQNVSPSESKEGLF